MDHNLIFNPVSSRNGPFLQTLHQSAGFLGQNTNKFYHQGQAESSGLVNG
jgi:hypothetical protein